MNTRATEALEAVWARLEEALDGDGRGGWSPGYVLQVVREARDLCGEALRAAADEDDD